ncbi:DDRGK domain-containing protein 1 [Sabethes cyaneus]|uniref:DDRGK domain-containing protein 1 n=1 Tax=Sabethes cyaneus TaxID=53552 RepID=UPI00237DD25F|nr:DDRGK domain-containing protein 1 [Sabethes cyaneus]
MELIFLITIAVALLVVLLTLYIFSRKESSNKAEAQRAEPPNVARRAQVIRNQRNRARAAEPQADDRRDIDSDHEEDIPHAIQDYSSEKIGAKKRAKLEAKAEKKAQREVELKIREEQKKKDALLEEERKRVEEKEAEEEKRREETERKAREEIERKEHEEYIRMKESFCVEEEGFDKEEENDKQNMLQEFINFVMDNKVIVLEDLAVRFKLKTQSAIDRITELQKDGRLSGVIDDRGKFIYISEDELRSVAKFIKQRGRIAISDLAENSSSLINLVPVVSGQEQRV